MINDLLFKGLKHESTFQDLPIVALDSGLYACQKNGVSYIMEKHEKNDGVYFNIVASMRNKRTHETYTKELQEKRGFFR